MRSQAALCAESILLRDYSALNAEAGSRLILERRLGAIARFEHGDAFDAEALAGLRPRPTLAVISGLYELFPDNDPVSRSLEGLGRAVRQEAVSSTRASLGTRSSPSSPGL